MSGPTGAEVQKAIDFLSGPGARKLHECALSPYIDYEAIARQGSELGHGLTANGLREAFRCIIRARLISSGRSCRDHGSHQ